MEEGVARACPHFCSVGECAPDRILCRAHAVGLPSFPARARTSLVRRRRSRAPPLAIGSPSPQTSPPFLATSFHAPFASPIHPPLVPTKFPSRLHLLTLSIHPYRPPHHPSCLSPLRSTYNTSCALAFWRVDVRNLMYTGAAVYRGPLEFNIIAASYV